MLHRHGTRLEIGTAEDVADLDEMEMMRRSLSREVRRGEDPYSAQPSESPSASADPSTTPKPISRRVVAQHWTSSTPPPPPQL